MSSFNAYADLLKVKIFKHCHCDRGRTFGTFGYQTLLFQAIKFNCITSFQLFRSLIFIVHAHFMWDSLIQLRVLNTKHRLSTFHFHCIFWHLPLIKFTISSASLDRSPPGLKGLSHPDSVLKKKTKLLSMEKIALKFETDMGRAKQKICFEIWRLTTRGTCNRNQWKNENNKI